jgi:hypothetical protein
MNAFDQYPKLLCSFHCHSRKYLSHSQGVQFIQSTYTGYNWYGSSYLVRFLLRIAWYFTKVVRGQSPLTIRLWGRLSPPEAR